MITLLIHKSEFKIDSHTMAQSSRLFKQEFSRKGFNGTFNIVSFHHLLPKFFQFCNNKDIRDIEGDEIFGILDIATEWNCTKKIINIISAQIFSTYTVPQLIIKLHECNDALPFIAAEKLPEFLKYSPIMLLPISTIYKLFESSRVCMPSQIDLTNFVILYFRNYGLPAMNFVHYINPRTLPPKKLAEIKSVFTEFNCDHIFPEFDIKIPKISDSRQYTIQARILTGKLNNESEKFSSLKGDMKKAEKKMAEIKIKHCNHIQKREKMEKESKNLSLQLEEVNKFIQEFEKTSGDIHETKERIANADSSIAQFEKELAEHEDELNAYADELNEYNPGDENSLFSKMERETKLVEENSKDVQEKINEFRDNNKRIKFYMNQIVKYEEHIQHLSKSNYSKK